MDVVTGRTQVVVLGGGLVGGFIAKQGARDPEWHVTLVDRSRDVLDTLQREVVLSTNQADLTDKDVVQKCIEEADLVIVALPGHIGYKALEWVLDAGKLAIDISFYPEDPQTLQDVAEARQTTAVVDCGVMPGLGGIIAAQLASRLDTAEGLKIMVGGIPADRDSAGPFEYKAPFSPADVIEEYTRPARMRFRGQTITVPPMSDVERFTVEGIGDLEAFNTDGLRTLLTSLDIPNMVEKTIRYSWHATRVEFLRALGFFDTNPLRVKGMMVRPLDVAAAVLTKSWRVTEGYQELTFMTVEVEGVKDGRRIRHRCELLDRTEEDGTLSMARTTGYPALLAARALLQGKLNGPGIIPAERIGLDEALFTEFMSGCLRYGIILTMTQQDLGSADEALAEPLVVPPARLWQPPVVEEEEALPVVPRARVAAVAAAEPEPTDELEARLAQAMESVAAAAGEEQPEADTEPSASETGPEAVTEPVAAEHADSPAVAAELATETMAVETAQLDESATGGEQPLEVAGATTVPTEPEADPEPLAEERTQPVQVKTVIDEIEEVLASFYAPETAAVEPGGNGHDVLAPAQPGNANGAVNSESGPGELLGVHPPAANGHDLGREAR